MCYFVDGGGDGRTILKRISEEQIVWMETGILWHRWIRHDVYGTGTCNSVSPGTARKFFQSKRAMAQGHTVAFCCTNPR
jgi:hypothetical protein